MYSPPAITDLLAAMPGLRLRDAPGEGKCTHRRTPAAPLSLRLLADVQDHRSGAEAVAAWSSVADHRAPWRTAALVPCLIGLLVGLTVACSPQSAAPQGASAEPTTSLRPEATDLPTPGATTVAQFPVDAVGEASGLAVSRRNPGVAWVLDDGPGTTGVLAVPYGPSATAATGGAVTLEGLDGRDTEALAVGDCAADEPRSCLFIGDIGDNRRSRDSVRIHRVVEPDLSDGLPDAPVAADTVTLTYPDGPTDAEAMFAVGGRLFIISKAPFAADTAVTGATRLYELPRFGDGELQPRGEVPVPRPSVALAADVVGNVVTGADATGDAVVLRTYDHAVRYTAPASGDDPATFGTWPFDEIPTTGPLQTEAIAFDVGDCATLTAGEGSGRIWRTPCTQRASPSGSG